MAWKGIVAQRFTVEEFGDYLKTINWVLWRPSGITLHHTWAPDIASRPHGLQMTHIRNLEMFYRDEKHWQSGPHLFIDQNGIWVFTPLTLRGVHAVSFNRTHLGIEMLGNYDDNEWNAAVRANAVGAMAKLCERLYLTEKNINFHRDDPLTTKTCPGTKISKTTVQNDVRLALATGVVKKESLKPQALVIIDNKWKQAIEATIVGGRVFASPSKVAEVMGKTIDKNQAVTSVADMAKQYGYDTTWNSQQKKLYLYKK